VTIHQVFNQFDLKHSVSCSVNQLLSNSVLQHTAVSIASFSFSQNCHSLFYTTVSIIVSQDNDSFLLLRLSVDIQRLGCPVQEIHSYM